MKRTCTRTASTPPGTDPDIVIRIAPDGRVYFHDITGPMRAIVQTLAGRTPAREAPQEVAINPPSGGMKLD